MKYQPDDYLTTSEIAAEFGYTTRTIYTRKKEMQLMKGFSSGIFLGGRKIRYKELCDFLRYVHTPEYHIEKRKLEEKGLLPKPKKKA
ncbi:DNA-binding protein [Lactococcus hircilactis]|uniref:DNA-binding protein n=1 Tax=Lactococcus hircilactis TaxID=1494462 RepID=A0A7X1ZAM0_9LACT|nr:DNA-binding protein [Lactococcus hircilactis]MQW40752.1 DNA-binding protein [Lactococcus hircilactis]